MLTLNGKNLNERHKELNMKVNEAASNNVDFEQIKNNTEKSDVDKLFKIDLASKRKNIEYIIEVLKSGDDLHILRALKCVWMYEDQFSNIINVDYLCQQVFPFMSLKMKKKLLTSISTYVRNEDCTKAFCDYSIDTKLPFIAYKFAIHTSHDYKLHFMKKYPDIIEDLKEMSNLKYFIGNSFTLADAYFATLERMGAKLTAFNRITHLYSVSDVKYLDMLEKHFDVGEHIEYNDRLGLRISKNIIIKHENRVSTKPALYIIFLNKSSLKKYTTPDNAKKYAIALLPDDVKKFWDNYFCTSYEYLLNILPPEERFGFIKRIFYDKYPGKPFEMSSEFYIQKNYRFMTAEQKNKWALDQIASQNEILGSGNDYQWYKFVKFDIAFDEVKKLVMNTPDRTQRNAILKILVESAKTQRDIEKLCKYYNGRHNNEQPIDKHIFASCVERNHNVYGFDKDCWTAFNEIYENLNVYSMIDDNPGNSVFKIVALIYHIIHKMEVHDALKLYIDKNVEFYIIQANLNNLNTEIQDMVRQYLSNFYVDKITELGSVTYDDEVKRKLGKYIKNFLDCLSHSKKSGNDIPEEVMKLMQLDWCMFSHHHVFHKSLEKINQAGFIRFLKKDAQLVVEKLPLIRNSIEEILCCDYYNKLLRKLKIYFSNDISKVFLNFYKEILNEGDVRLYRARAACVGIFLLADDSFKADFMTKYAPTEGKFNRSKINQNLLNIQEAICSTAIYSRPPVPLKNMLMYVKGDYVPRCLPIMNYYAANLPIPLLMEFTVAMLNNPISIKKHGLRLAFTYFEAANLRELVLNTWNKCKNVSLRLIIYKALYNMILEDTNAQETLFETLKILTLDLQKDDSKDIFELWHCRRLPERIMPEYISTMWAALKALPDNKMFCALKVRIIDYLCSNIIIMRQDIIRSIVEEFVRNAFSTDDSIKLSLKSNLNGHKWDLVTHYIMLVQNHDDLETKLDFVKLILTECLRRYNLVDEKKYIMRQFCRDFINKLLRRSLDIPKPNEYVNEMLEAILEMLQALFSIDDIYMFMWQARIHLILNKALLKLSTNLENVNDKAERCVILRADVLQFGKDLGTLFKEFMDKGIYFPSFLSRIQNVLITHVKSAYHFVRRLEFEIKPDHLLVIISVALLEFKTNDMYMLALNILPNQCCADFEEDYKHVLSVLKGVNPELRCQIYDKFVYSDFEARPFLQL